MGYLKILILGNSGFIGTNLFNYLKENSNYNIITTTINQKLCNAFTYYFNLLDKDSWESIVELNADVFINATGYGVVKLETNIDLMYDINYIMLTDFLEFLESNSNETNFIQFGTAFEYDLNIEKITEETQCIPKTHYGISKFLTSNFILNRNCRRVRYLVLRPFALFGPYENSSKIIPYLINSQLKNEAVNLSSGEQFRDYLFVEDLCRFILEICSKDFNALPRLMNIGSGNQISIKELGNIIAENIESFNSTLWKWNSIPYRANEGNKFYNYSKLAFENGLKNTELAKGIKKTIQFYRELRTGEAAK
ncbi:MAG: GDP-6-deoxy-D-talose 4-dehydrogenase [Ignavibacteriaceae bacterium]|nr:GDP-6-deoxy-D-talose 4-dehydrogenase [Ignavibacteriaceae bacterium]